MEMYYNIIITLSEKISNLKKLKDVMIFAKLINFLFPIVPPRKKVGFILN